MAKVSTSISLDADVKERAQSILVELGLDLSTAVGMFLRQLVRERSLPFTATLNVPNAVTIAAMEEAEEMLNNPEKYPRYDNMADLVRALEE